MACAAAFCAFNDIPNGFSLYWTRIGSSLVGIRNSEFDASAISGMILGFSAIAVSDKAKDDMDKPAKVAALPCNKERRLSNKLLVDIMVHLHIE